MPIQTPLASNVSPLLLLAAIASTGLTGCNMAPATPNIGSTESLMVGRWKSEVVTPTDALGKSLANGTVYELRLFYGKNTNEPNSEPFLYGNFTSTVVLNTGTNIAVGIAESLVEGLDVNTSNTVSIPRLKVDGLQASALEGADNAAEPVSNIWLLQPGWTLQLDAANSDIMYVTHVIRAGENDINNLRLTRQR